jgi:hypothetical protein
VRERAADRLLLCAQEIHAPKEERSHPHGGFVQGQAKETVRHVHASHGRGRGEASPADWPQGRSRRPIRYDRRGCFMEGAGASAAIMGRAHGGARLSSAERDRGPATHRTRAWTRARVRPRNHHRARSASFRNRRRIDPRPARGFGGARHPPADRLGGKNAAIG